MSSKPDKQIGDRELLQTSDLPMTADAILSDFTHYFGRMLGRQTIQIDSPFLYQSVVYAARDRLMERWNKTRNLTETYDTRRTACAKSSVGTTIAVPQDSGITLW